MNRSSGVVGFGSVESRRVSRIYLRVGESLLLPMAPQLIVARLYPRRSSVQPEIRGAFEAMSLPDLLQTLGMNQRDVRVTLDFDGEAGVLELRSGYLALARFRGHQGMKAMCRILEQEGGTFSMSDAADSASTTLIASVGEALMMAIQFKDEKANLLEETFKDPRALLCRSATMSCPVGMPQKSLNCGNISNVLKQSELLLSAHRCQMRWS